MLDKELSIKEMYDIRHKHDNNPNRGFDYENNMFKKTLSPVMLRNENNSGFISYLQDMMVTLFESTLEIRNLFNYSVSKYYNGHSD